ncbi:MAG: tRNA-uridine aminocarboxypropyltransferase [Pseudomonadota bacterium]
MTRLPDSKRLMCATCLRPQKSCICHWIRPAQHTVEVVILQHPLEVTHAKGSARLLHLSLPHSVLVTGEVFEEKALHALLHAPLPRSCGKGGRQAVLLYPETPGQMAMGLAAPRALAEPLLRDPASLRLVVLDGTWRKSRKMLYLNPLLQHLPRLALDGSAPSHYRIRKAHAPGQLSTLEATCQALMQLERDSRKFQPLLDAFDGFVAQQSGFNCSG